MIPLRLVIDTNVVVSAASNLKARSDGLLLAMTKPTR
jgi:predicted nucleic acid-binding protein